MTLEEMFDIWKQDCQIDRSELGNESLRSPQLHHKWFRMLSVERLALKDLEARYKKLRWLKLDFYTNGPNDLTRAAGWQLPARGRILKAEAAGYVENDPDVLAAGKAMAVQAEMVDAIENIIKTINNRGFAIKNAIEWLRFTNGG